MCFQSNPEDAGMVRIRHLNKTRRLIKDGVAS